MKVTKIYQELASRKITAEALAKKAVKNRELIAPIVEGMGEQVAEVKYGCAKALRIIVEEEPELLYPYFDQFASMLRKPASKIFLWEAIYLLAGLAPVDEDEKLEGVLPDYFAHIEGPMMITAANIVKGGAELVAARPEFAQRAVKEILRTERGKYETAECYEIVIGNALKTFTKIYKWVEDKQPVVHFAERHKGSSRPSTRKVAEALLAKAAKKKLLPA